MNLIEKTHHALQDAFPNNQTSPRFFRAPGRVNLIGEHTDYNDGFVLPVAINFYTVIAAVPRTDQTVNVHAIDVDQQDSFELTYPVSRHPKKIWANYIRGMANQILEKHPGLHGIDLAVAGNVPRSGGLSSSASLEMVFGQTLMQMNGLAVDGVTLALMGQKTEHTYVDVNCGIMDQFISSLGQENHALLIDCRDLSYQNVSIPEETAIIVVDSGIQRGLVDSAYNNRRAECEAAAAHFKVKALRDLDEETFVTRAQELSDVTRRRAQHVITENTRTLAAAEVLSQGIMTALEPLMSQSHLSMRDDFEITVPGIDKLVEIMQGVPGIYGARMTGGGFGGCCVCLAPLSVAPVVEAAIADQYTKETGYQATVYMCQASAGAGEITDIS